MDSPKQIHEEIVVVLESSSVKVFRNPPPILTPLHSATISSLSQSETEIGSIGQTEPDTIDQPKSRQ